MTKKVYSANQLNINQEMLDIDALNTVRHLQSSGYKAYIVGGGVRDLLLGAKPKDFDIATNATPEQTKRVFHKNAIIIGRRFKIVHVYFQRFNEERSIKLNRKIYDRHIIEVSTFRSNKVHNDDISNHGRILVDNNYGTMDEDAFRRDFTINALYYDPIAEKIYDYHNGIEDIYSKTMRIIGRPQDRYIEDPVRILRAIRLSEKLHLTIEDNTLIPFKATRHLLLNEPRGRLFEELSKIFNSGHSVAVIKDLIDLKVPRKLFPIIDKLFIDKKDQMAMRVLERTDTRIQQNGDVSLMFIFASLMWSLINESTQYYQQQFNLPYRQALMDAIIYHKRILFDTGVTQSMYSSLRDIWFTQLDFDRPNIKTIDNLIRSSRFRQGWHLFTLRNEFNQVDPEMFEWWNTFIHSEDENEKTDLLIRLVDLSPHEEIKKKRKRKKRKKNHNNSQTTE